MGNMPRYWPWIIVGIILFFYVVLSFTKRYEYDSTSVCPQCGAILNTREHLLPGIGLPIHASHTVWKSPLAKVLEKHHLVGVHQHDWHFCHGSGAGVYCALGSWRYAGDAAHDRGLHRLSTCW